MALKTLGDYRVGIEFNPSGDDRVYNVKKLAAELIDTINESLPESDPEVERLRSLAMTHIEDGAMWAVKALTKRPRD